MSNCDGTLVSRLTALQDKLTKRVPFNLGDPSYTNILFVAFDGQLLPRSASIALTVNGQVLVDETGAVVTVHRSQLPEGLIWGHIKTPRPNSLKLKSGLEVESTDLKVEISRSLPLDEVELSELEYIRVVSKDTRYPDREYQLYHVDITHTTKWHLYLKQRPERHGPTQTQEWS